MVSAATSPPRCGSASSSRTGLFGKIPGTALMGFLLVASAAYGAITSEIVCNWDSQEMYDTVSKVMADSDYGDTHEIKGNWRDLNIAIVEAKYSLNGKEEPWGCSANMKEAMDGCCCGTEGPSRKCPKLKYIPHTDYFSYCQEAGAMTTDAERERYLASARRVASNLESKFRVQFTPFSSALSFGDKDHSCKTKGQRFTFADKDQNLGFAVTYVPFRNETDTEKRLYQDEALYALPCAGGKTITRPLLIRVNFNPPKARTLTDAQLDQTVLHHVLHAMQPLSKKDNSMGFKNTDVSGLGRTVAYQTRAKSWYQRQVGCSHSDMDGIPFDEEYRLGSDRGPTRSHWESRVINTDVMSGGSTTDTISAITVASMEKIYNTDDDDDYYWYKQQTQPWVRPSTASPSNDRCGNFLSKCSTTAGGLGTRFCSGSSTGTAACSANRSSYSACNVKTWTTEELVPGATALPTEQQYFTDKALKGGTSQYNDFCPEPNPNDISCTGSSPFTTDQLTAIGAVYGVTNSRCFEALGVHRTGSTIPTNAENGIRCMKVRCPFGVRIEFQLQGSTDWHACPTDGSSGDATLSANADYSGTVKCPEASTICSDTSLTPAIPTPTWRQQEGYPLEYAIVEGVARQEDAVRVCKDFGSGSKVAFLPDTQFGLATAVSTFWTGAQNANAWAETFDWPVPKADQFGNAFKDVTTGTKKCWIFDKTNANLVQTSCTAMAGIVCVRPLKDYNAPKCSRGTLCLRQNAQDESKTEQLYVPISPTLKTKSAASAACTAATGDKLYDFAGEAGSVLELRQRFGSLAGALGSSLVALKVNNELADGASVPFWGEAISSLTAANVIASKDGKSCFVLRGSTNASWALQLTAIPCDAPSPALCIRSPLAFNGSIPGYIRSVLVYRVPQTLSVATAICAAGNATLAPMVSKVYMDTVLEKLASLQTVTYLEASQTATKAWIGAERLSDRIAFTPYNYFPVSASATATFLPTSTEGFSVTGKLSMSLPNTDKKYSFQILAEGEKSPFVCAYYPRAEPLPACSYGKFCWFEECDNKLLYDSITPIANDDMVSVCSKLNSSLPLGAPELPERLHRAATALFGTTNLPALWTGLKYNATLNALVYNNNQTNKAFPPDSPSVVSGSFQDGECAAYGWSPTDRAFRIFPRTCTDLLPYNCRLPLASVGWIPYTPLYYSSDPRRFLVYTVLSSPMAFARARQTCKALDAELAYLTANSTNLFNVGQLFEKLSIPSTKRLWFGLATASPAKFNTTFYINATETISTGTSGPFNCYSIGSDGGIQETPSEKCADESTKFGLLCSKSSVIVNWTASGVAYAGKSGQLNFSIPETPGGPNSQVVFKVKPNITGVTISNPQAKANQTTTVSYSLPCSAFPKPVRTWIGLEPEMVSENAGVYGEAHVEGRASTMVWPCVTFSSNLSMVVLRAEQYNPPTTLTFSSTIILPGNTYNISLSHNGTIPLTFNQSTFVLDATTTSRSIGFVAQKAGVGSIFATPTSCSPAEACPTTFSKTLVTSYRILHIPETTINATFPKAAFVGASHTAVGKLWLTKPLNTRPRDEITVTLSAVETSTGKPTEAIYISPSKFEKIQQSTNYSFSFSSSEDGNFSFVAHFEVSNRANVSNTTLFVDANITLHTLFFSPIYPLKMGIQLPRFGSVYAGDRFNMTVQTSEKAVSSGAHVGFFVNNSQYYVSRTGDTEVLSISDKTCCNYTLSFAMTSDIGAVWKPGDPTSLDLTLKPNRTGPFVVRFALPLALPYLNFILVKSLNIEQFPSRMMAGGTLHSDIVLSLPQCPVSKSAEVMISCNNTNIRIGARMPLVFPANDFENTTLLTKRLELSVPHWFNFNGQWDATVNCTISIDAGIDVDTTTSYRLVTLWPKSQSYIVSQIPVYVVRNQVFQVVLVAKFDKRSPVVSFAGTADSRVTVGSESLKYYSTETHRIFTVTIGDTASPGRACINWSVTNPEMYVVPNASCFTIVPKIHLELGPRTSYTQPVGASNAETLVVKLSFPTLLAPTTVTFECLGATETVASFNPSSLSYEIGGPQSQNISFVGLGVDSACDVRYRVISSGPQVENNATLVQAYEMPIYFVPLLQITMSAHFDLDLLFLGTANSKRVSVSIASVPSSPVNITLHFNGEPGTVSIEPPQITFRASGDETLVKHYILTALRMPSEKFFQGKMASVTTSVSTLAKEFDPTVAGGVNFKIHELYTISATQHRVPVTDVVVFCNGIGTKVPIDIVLSSLPVQSRTMIRVSLTDASTVNASLSGSPTETVLSSSPTRLSFGGGLSVLSQTLGLICPEKYGLNPREDVLQAVSFTITAPPEYAPSPVFTARLRAAARYIITDFPAMLTHGDFPESFDVKPTEIPPPGTQLSLEFFDQCQGRVELMQGSGAVKLLWDGEAMKKRATLRGIAPVTNCAVSLRLSSNNTATNFLTYAIQALVTVVSQPTLTPVIQVDAPTVQTDQLHAGLVVFRFVVAHTMPVNGSTVGFGGLIQDVTKDSVETTEHGALLFSSSDPSDSSSFISYFKEHPECANLSAYEPNILELRISAPDVPPATIKEKILIMFSRMCLQRKTASPQTGRNSFNFTIIPVTLDVLASQKAVVGAAISGAAVTSTFAGPSAATQAAKISVLMDASTCPLPEEQWKELRQDDLDFVENPPNIKLGTIEQLGGYFGAAVMDTALVIGLTGVHMVIAFVVFAYRRDSAVADKSFAHALALVHFPALDVFFVIFWGPCVVEFGLRTALYSTSLWRRGVGGALSAFVVFGVGFWMYRIVRKRGVIYVNSEVEEKYSLKDKLLKERGTWELDPVGGDQDFLMKYDSFFDDHTDQAKAYLLFDYGATCVIALVNAYEAHTKQKCIAKYSSISLVFLVMFVYLAWKRPFRKHVLNVFFSLIAFFQFGSVMTSVIALSGHQHKWSTTAAAITMTAIGGLLILKMAADICITVIATQVGKLVQKVKSHKKGNGDEKNWPDPVGELSLQDIFPGVDVDPSWEMSLLQPDDKRREEYERQKMEVEKLHQKKKQEQEELLSIL